MERIMVSWNAKRFGDLLGVNQELGWFLRNHLPHPRVGNMWQLSFPCKDCESSKPSVCILVLFARRPNLVWSDQITTMLGEDCYQNHKPMWCNLVVCRSKSVLFFPKRFATKRSIHILCLFVTCNDMRVYVFSCQAVHKWSQPWETWPFASNGHMQMPQNRLFQPLRRNWEPTHGFPGDILVYGETSPRFVWPSLSCWHFKASYTFKRVQWVLIGH